MRILEVHNKKIQLLLSDENSCFQIPEYQRQYDWGLDQCQTLWEDLCSFTFPDGESENFIMGNEYYLGALVIYKCKDMTQSGTPYNTMEVIDGQQRLTTLTLLIRAFMSSLAAGEAHDEGAKLLINTLGLCIFKKDNNGFADRRSIKLDSRVITDNHRDQLKDILLTGEARNSYKSNYAKNYRFFQEAINQFKDEHPTDFAELPKRILEYCYVLPIETDTQESALRIFSTLNDRGLPLSDSDIFKAEMYKFFDRQGKKAFFMEEWTKLNEICSNSVNNISMDDLFIRYMYFVRSKNGTITGTSKGLRSFYETYDGGSYSLLKSEKTFCELRMLANFWSAVYISSDDRIPSEIRQRFFVLQKAPNKVWVYLVSVFFLNINERNINGNTDEIDWHLNDNFKFFLDKTIAFVIGQSLVAPGIASMRPPMYREMLNIAQNSNVSFSDFKFDREDIKNKFDPKEEVFDGTSGIVRFVLTWWAFDYMKDMDDGIIPLSNAQPLHVEHIYSRSRNFSEPLTNEQNLESIGNKALLEAKINIRASDYRYEDKREIYRRGRRRGRGRSCPTKNKELLDIVDDAHTDFSDKEIEERTVKIRDKLVSYLDEMGLIKN